MEMPKNYLADLMARGKTAKSKDYTEYQDMVNTAAKLCGMKYIVMHKRIEKAFMGKTFEFVKSCVWSWIHEAQKADNAGLSFNVNFMRYSRPDVLAQRQAKGLENYKRNNPKK